MEGEAADLEYAREGGESWVDLVEQEQKSLELTPALRMEAEIEVDVEMTESRTATKRKKSTVVVTDSLESASEPDQRAKLRSTHKRRIMHPTIVPASDPTPTEYESSENAYPSSNPERSQSGKEVESSKGEKPGRPKKRTRAVNSSLVEKEIMAATSLT